MRAWRRLVLVVLLATTSGGQVLEAVAAQVGLIATAPSSSQPTPRTREAGGRHDARIRFRSVALEHDVTVKFDNIANREIRFRSVNLIPGAHASGAYVLQPMAGGTRTRVVATLYLRVGGLARAFVSAKKAQAMRQSKLRADLGDVAAQFAPRPRAAAR